MDISQSLRLALRYEGINKLPDALRSNGRVIWVRAICLVTKADMSKNYVIMTYDGSSTSVIKDFGSSSPIARIEAIHPISVFYRRQLPILYSDNDIVSYLCQGGYDPEESQRLINEDPQEVRRRIFKTAIILAQDHGGFWQKYHSGKKKRPVRRG